MTNWEYDFFIGKREVVPVGSEPESCSIRDKSAQGLVKHLIQGRPETFSGLKVKEGEENPDAYTLIDFNMSRQGGIFQIRLSDSKTTSPVEDGSISGRYWLVSKGITAHITYGPAEEGDAFAVSLLFDEIMGGVSQYYTGMNMHMKIPGILDFPFTL